MSLVTLNDPEKILVARTRPKNDSIGSEYGNADDQNDFETSDEKMIDDDNQQFDTENPEVNPRRTEGPRRQREARKRVKRVSSIGPLVSIFGGKSTLKIDTETSFSFAGNKTGGSGSAAADGKGHFGLGIGYQSLESNAFGYDWLVNFEQFSIEDNRFRIYSLETNLHYLFTSSIDIGLGLNYSKFYKDDFGAELKQLPGYQIVFNALINPGFSAGIKYSIKKAELKAESGLMNLNWRIEANTISLCLTFVGTTSGMSSSPEPQSFWN